MSGESIDELTILLIITLLSSRPVFVSSSDRQEPSHPASSNVSGWRSHHKCLLYQSCNLSWCSYCLTFDPLIPSV